jgi:methyl-accepting chemotaxis protein
MAGRALSIRNRLRLGFAVLLVLIAASSVISISATRRQQVLLREIDHNRQLVEANNRIVYGLMQGSAAVRGASMEAVRLADGMIPGPDRREEFVKQRSDGWTAAGEALDKLKVLAGQSDNATEKSTIDDISAKMDAYRTAQDETMSLLQSNNPADAAKALTNMATRTTPANKELMKILNGFVADCNKASLESVTTAKSVAASTVMVVALALLASLLCGVFFARQSIRGVLVPLRRTMQALDTLAECDLREKLEIQSEDEMGQMAEALNRTIDAMRQTVQAISQSAKQVAQSGEKIAATAASSLQAAQTQADQATQVATAMAEMSSTVMDISSNSQNASGAAHSAASTARNGGRIVSETLETMQGIAGATARVAEQIGRLGKSSEQIGKIASVIDDIADQTNLLALNAAIEAARAGEHGRGFAVVADEVRKLAERTATATKEIAEMIHSVQEEARSAVDAMQAGSAEVNLGVAKAGEAGKALEEIIQVATGVGDMITQIATAATEQSSATEEINSNISRIANMAQESSQAAEATSEACGKLTGQATKLESVVDRFRLDGGAEVAEEEAASGFLPPSVHRQRQALGGYLQ